MFSNEGELHEYFSLKTSFFLEEEGQLPCAEAGDKTFLGGVSKFWIGALGCAVNWGDWGAGLDISTLL